MKQFFITTLVIALIVLGIYCIYPMWEREYEIQQTKRQLKILATEALRKLPPDTKDVWGEVIFVTREETKYGIVVAVKSKGPDKKINTRDDISVDKADINWTRTAGYVIGDKSKEFGAGVIDGLRKKLKKEK